LPRPPAVGGSPGGAPGVRHTNATDALRKRHVGVTRAARGSRGIATLSCDAALTELSRHVVLVRDSRGFWNICGIGPASMRSPSQKKAV
jgi:hypothetical protein